ncbi:hypothetical protein FOVG_00151 [Fusarium oxysporum f. sp. pisi HDV247]|uniref:Uncharacterized protein n=3 Tax=Fusarium oxysporum TaxID=5507 RepID=N4TR69_FUSC1|nr:hypothetical protein FOC1_g10016550 [Fusarium oxysporum f. sp. cubense race 1]EXA51527.1 hypothetical protein FOVG_00151 [Fusarium oxysporum f. sp. pisi HDV247]
MHLSSLIPIITLSLGAANAMAIEEEGTLEARSDQCNPGINLIKLKIKPGKYFTGVGKPGKCYNLPANIKYFDVYSDDTKSLVSCFDCKVYTEVNCKGSYVSIEGADNFAFKTTKKPHYKSWRCGPP